MTRRRDDAQLLKTVSKLKLILSLQDATLAAAVRRDLDHLVSLLDVELSRRVLTIETWRNRKKNKQNDLAWKAHL